MKQVQPRHPTTGRFVPRTSVKQGKAKPNGKQAPKGGQKLK